MQAGREIGAGEGPDGAQAGGPGGLQVVALIVDQDDVGGDAAQVGPEARIGLGDPELAADEPVVDERRVGEQRPHRGDPGAREVAGDGDPAAAGPHAGEQGQALGA